MPKVYIPHLPTRLNPLNNKWVPTISLSPAAELGTLCVINDRPSHAAPENIGEAHDRVIEEMATMDSRDYIAVIGDPVLCALAIHEALRHWNVVQVLRWNRLTRAYDLLRIATEEES